MTQHPQLGLPLGAEVTYATEDFFVSGCNRAAFEQLHHWPEGAQALVLYGPEASGKTHLAHIWARQQQAMFIPAAQVTVVWVAQMLGEDGLSGHFVIDSLEQMQDETALFHLLNGLREQGGKALLVSVAAPSQLGITLADARSRLKALPAAALESPDDEVLRAVLIKQFSDRQLRVGEDVVNYLLTRIDRSFSDLRDWVERIDHAALASQHKVTVPWLRELLGNTAQEQ